ncbi:putative cytokinetic ring protein SteA [Luteipulveratus halotolerans]|uniref:Thiamin pyrophosphokinase n=1 Tax=Luteipulveratus halotolerans TaxID=1631356 RepID=A0A0L6CHZ4_9MICO|nr:putative cytokinetic ring protein SteA [Luteipulveratus halotolerans]KNX37344.1 thiamin pyrophosphokinase [Luteipulveratus halotolerans]
MRFSLRRHVTPEPAGVGGTVRVDARTKNLTKRLRPGDIAVINHRDIDQVSAEALVACRPAAVVNAAESISGRYPNLGPAILVDAGIPLIDRAGEGVMAAVSDGELAQVSDGDLVVGDTVVARGTLMTTASVQEALEDARAGLSTQMEAFAANTMEYLREERDLLLDGVGLPDIRTDMDGRPVLVVVRGYHYKEDIQILRPFIRDYKPVLIGVDGGADALVEAGMKPHMIVGDMDSVSDATLTSGAEVVVHAYRDGKAPGLVRVEELGVRDPVVFPATGTSEDIAMLLADDKGADLIVAVGTHATLVEFLDKGRAGMASTFLTRLRVGSKLVDAKGVSRLYRTTVPTWMLVVLVLSGFLALFVALASTPAGDTIFQLIGSRWDGFWSWLTGVFE